MNWHRPHLLGLKGMKAGEILKVLDTAESMADLLSREHVGASLRGKIVANLFYEPSTRTRTSFELAAKHLGAETVTVTARDSSMVKGEGLKDTALTMQAMGADIIVLRHRAAGAAATLARHLRAGVVNAGDGAHEHPTQALLDLFTIRRHLGSIKGVKVAIIGDIRYSRVARSNIWGLTTMGAEVRLAGPATLLPPVANHLGVPVFTRVEEALEGVDVVYVLRLQLERQQAGLIPGLVEYNRLYGIDEGRLRLANPGALVMHPGPVNRGVELMPEILEGTRSLVEEQVTNGVFVRMAVLYLLTGGVSS